VKTSAPPYDDVVVADFADAFGGGRGKHAGGRSSRWWIPIRVLLLLTVFTSLLAFMQKSPCRTHPWSNDFQYTRVCYTDVFALYYSEHLNGNQDTGSRLGVPYRDYPVEYPAVIGGLMWAAAGVTDIVHPNDPHNSAAGVVDNRGQTFFDVTVFGLAICALLITWSVARLAGRQRIWDAAMVALAPAIIFDGFINWDLVVRFSALASRRSSTPCSSWSVCCSCACGPVGCASGCLPQRQLSAGSASPTYPRG
jgi:uncharacterized membrane protein